MARAFNLSADELNGRFIAPLRAGQTIVYADREWLPAKTKVTIYEARELGPEEIGLDRGWGNVTRDGRDVTVEVLARTPVAAREPRAPEVDQMKERLLGRLAGGPVGLGEAVGLADDLLPDRRVSERLAVAELAVWELLHEQRVALIDESEWEPYKLPPESWQPTLLDAAAWGLQATTSSIRLARSESEANR